MSQLYFVVKLSGEARIPQGPFKPQSVLDQLKGGLLSWTDIAWSPNQKQATAAAWKRLFEFPEFQSILPALPPPEQLEAFIQTQQPRPESPKELPKSAQHLRPPFFLHVVGSERGPFTLPEVKDLLSKAKFADQVYFWAKGLPFWVPIQEIPGFEGVEFSQSKMVRTPNDVFLQAMQPAEGRAAHREGLVATTRIYLSSPEKNTSPAPSPQGFGVCLDVSATGAQIRLENQLPLKRDDLIRLEVIPLSLLKLPHFLIQARIVWVRPETLCIGVEFMSFERGGWEKLKSHLDH